MRVLNIFARTILVLLFAALMADRLYAAGLSTLAEVGKSQQSMQKELNKETKAYKAVKRGIETGAIKKGESADSIRSRYGQPVVVLSDGEAYAEKWLYKPGWASHFEGIKIYLFFGEDKKLAGVKILNRSKKDEEPSEN